MSNPRLNFFLIIFFFAASLPPMNKGLEAHSVSFFGQDSLALSDSTEVTDSLITDSTFTVKGDSLIPVYSKGFLSADNH